MKRVLCIVDDYGEHKYEIVKETKEVIETNCVTLFDEYPIRFNKKEERLEYYNGEYWDVYVPSDCIFGVNIITE